MTQDDVLKEFVDCRCSYVCECYEFVYMAMADEIVALRDERDTLRTQLAAARVALAKWWNDGEDDVLISTVFPNMNGDEIKALVTAVSAMKVQP